MKCVMLEILVKRGIMCSLCWMICYMDLAFLSRAATSCMICSTQPRLGKGGKNELVMNWKRIDIELIECVLAGMA